MSIFNKIYDVLSVDIFKRTRKKRYGFVHVTVTVTEALVLRPLLEDRGRITESVRILVPVDRMKQKCF